MANINKIKIGAVDPDSIMFDRCYLEEYQNIVSFGSLIPKDNTSALSQADNLTEWQVNDGWEVERVSDTRVAIKKFKIDTWGLRLVTNGNNISRLISNAERLRVRVEGLQYVHNNVVCHTAGSSTPDGFTKAYAGTGGYNIYWYPGQFDSGNFFQGIGIQQGWGYSGSDNDRDDSLEMAKHPWDIGTNNENIADGTYTGKRSDGSYSAVTIGLFGGVQNASAWHDESGDAYKVYDISDHPIYIDLTGVDDTTKDIDVTTVECWDAHCGTTQVWHKDKTVQNCWIKHRLAFPDGWSLYQSDFSTNPYIEWITATKFRVKGVPNGSISVGVPGESNSNYANLSFQGFSIKVYDKPDSVTAVFSREFSNITTSEGVTQALNNGDTEIAAFSKTVYRQDSESPISYNQAKFTFSANSFVDTDFTVELVPIYSSNGIISLNTWSNIYPSFYIPETTDMESYMTRIKWNIKPANPDIWTRVKVWYESNTAPLLSEQFADSTGLTEITLNIPPNEWYLFASDMFTNSEVEEVTLNVPRSSRISSGNHFFRRMPLLTTINVNLTGEGEQNWGAAFGCTDCSGWFELNSSIETYPANLINWLSKDLNVRSETIGCTIMSYAFDGCTSLKSIPSFDYEAAGFGEEANTIVPARHAEYMLNNCSSLQTIGPILDMKLVNPRTRVFSGLNALTSARIKNLNHGNWDFTNTLKTLDTTSVQYLFANLADLTTSDPNKHEDTIDKSFKNWTCNYFEAAANTPDWDYNMDTVRSFQARKGYATASEAPFVASTDATLDNMAITVSGLEEGDSVIFGASGDAAPDYTFTENDNYTITKTDSLVKGFKVLSSDPSKRTAINVVIENGLDYTNPAVSSATLYCPEEWTDKVTSEMITAANAKGWAIYIGGVEVQPS